MRTYFLKATTQKSYYKKAYIFEDEANGICELWSYNTHICDYNTKTGKFTKIWQGWSRTTNNHINDFRKLFDLSQLNKRQWLEMEAKDGKKDLFVVKGSNGFCEFKAQPLFDDYDTAENFADDLTDRHNGFVQFWAEEK